MALGCVCALLDTKVKKVIYNFACAKCSAEMGIFMMEILFLCGMLLLLTVIFNVFFLISQKYCLLHLQSFLSGEDERLTALNQDLEPFGFAFDPAADTFYSLRSCWQKDFGYCSLYDEAAARLNMIIDCEPITFFYRDKHWMIELWKGQYGMTTGAEIGIYNTDHPSLHIPGFFLGTFYHSAASDEQIFMSYRLFKGDTLLFERRDLHWWLTSFRLGEFSSPADLKMEITLFFPAREMLLAFAEGLKKMGYQKDEIHIGHFTVSFTFQKPHSRQPESRTRIREFIRQKSNLLSCRTYRYLTRRQETTLDKLYYLKQRFPAIYKQVLQFHYLPKLYQSFARIQSAENSPDRKEF